MEPDDTDHDEPKIKVDRKDVLTCPHPGCGRVLTRADRLRNHLKLHSGEKPFSCDAPGCSLSYATERALKRHQKEKHDQGEEEIDDLGNVIPKIPKLLKCPYEDCSVTFAHDQSVTRHVRLIHTRPPKFISCTRCDQKFKKHSKLKEHMYTHTGEKAFECEFPGCGKTFSRISHRKLHQRTHEGYKCDQCEKRLNSWSDLLAHRKEVHAKERERRFYCTEPGCEHAYTRTKYLRQHVARFHNGERVTCPHCQRLFSTKQKLGLHVAKFHDGENPPPLPQLRQKPCNKPRPKKLTPEEKQRRALERLAEQLSGVRKGPVAEIIAPPVAAIVESPNQVREVQ